MKKTLLAVALSGLYASAASAATPSVEEMWEIIQQQQAEISRLKGAQQATDAKVEATVDAVENGPIGNVAQWVNKTTIGGYGEVLYNNGTQSTDGGSRSKEIDVQRFVLYFGHEFDEDLRLFSELEIEHANTGASGEVELEQAYIEWDYAENHSVLAGLFLAPLGLINETHEPETFYGVERPRVESRIIPTTYRLNGVKFAGQIADGWSYDLALHEGLSLASNLSIRSSRQGGSRANADSLAGTARVKYTGIKGLELGLAVQRQDDLLQGGTVTNSPVGTSGKVGGLLTEVHAVYENGPFGLRALYAQWDIDSDITSISNTSGGSTFTGLGRDEQRGWYIEPSYKLSEKLGIFTRYESIDERAGSNTGAAKDSEEKRILVGANYWLRENVVLKADVQFDEDENKTSSNELDGFNLGLGWSF